jgi:hypothetical protein
MAPPAPAQSERGSHRPSALAGTRMDVAARVLRRAQGAIRSRTAGGHCSPRDSPGDRPPAWRAICRRGRDEPAHAQVPVKGIGCAACVGVQRLAGLFSEIGDGLQMCCRGRRAAAEEVRGGRSAESTRFRSDGGCGSPPVRIVPFGRKPVDGCLGSREARTVPIDPLTTAAEPLRRRETRTVPIEPRATTAETRSPESAVARPARSPTLGVVGPWRR